MVKKYVIIGHWRENRDVITSAIDEGRSIKEVRENCAGNGLVPYVVISENRFHKLEEITDSFNMYEEVKKLTSNWRRWGDIADYFFQCSDIIEERLKMYKADFI